MQRNDCQETNRRGSARDMNRKSGAGTVRDGEAERFIRKNKRQPDWKKIIGVEIVAIILAQLVIIVLLIIVIARIWI